MASCEVLGANHQDENLNDVLLHLLGQDEGQPVCEAIRNGNEQMVRHASLELEGPSTMSPKREAIVHGRPDFLLILVERDDTISEDLVAAACERKDRECVRILIDAGWSINQPVFSAASLLCFATEDVEFMRWLTEIGADTNAKSNLDEPVLAIAISHGSMDVVRFLIAQGADITHGNLLHCAAERRNQSEGAQIVTYLTQNGLDVNAYRYENPVARRLRAMSRLPTPLHVACHEQNIPVVRTLLKYGADPDRMVLEAGRLTPPTVLERARTYNNQALVELLIGATK